MFEAYRHSAPLAFSRAIKAWPVAFSLVIYGVVILVVGQLVSPLGLVGGIILGLVSAACLSSYVHLLSKAIQGSRLFFRDLIEGVSGRFWDVISVMFAFWIISFGVQIVTRSLGRNGEAVAAMIALAMAFFFNAVPELLYLGRSRSFSLLAESGRFVVRNPVAWFLPNLVLATLLLLPSGRLAVHDPRELLLVFSHIFTPSGVATALLSVPYWMIVILLLLLHLAMVFRGLLFVELESGNPRLRAFRRAAGS